MAEIYITSQELIKTLKISSQELADLEAFFDADSEDEWELVEGKDYRITIRSTGLREYTSSGAYTIAKYLEETRKLGFWQIIKEWFLHTKREIRRAFIKKHILDNCSSLMRRNNILFISRSDVVSIFKTRSDYLTKTIEFAKRTESPLLLGQDYEDFVDEGLYFSMSGIFKLAQVLKERQSKTNRQEWCWDVGEVVEPQISDIVARIKQRHTQIQKAKDKVKNSRDKKTCLVTNEKKNRADKWNLAAHHLYSQSQFPHLADSEDNLITLKDEVHDQFHLEHMGGRNKASTIDDFIDFVQKYYPSNSSVVIWLQHQKLKLGNQQPIGTAKNHVLYLPASRV
jgi:hypothetical protein